MRRREFILLLGGVAGWSIAARAQTARNRAVPVVGVLGPEAPSPRTDAFREGLQDLGYVVGQNVELEYRWGHGAFHRLSDFAAELVALDVDVIVASLTQAALVAKRATSRIPIVMVGVGDPIGTGLITSLSRPGGNVTGTSSIAPDLVGKQMELIQEFVPKGSAIAVLWNPENLAFQQLQLKQAEDASRVTGASLHLFEARRPEDFPTAFATIKKEGIPALAILGDPMFALNAEALSKLATESRLPTVGANRAHAEAGTLVAYGPSYPSLYRRAAFYVDKILKGTKPGDLPVEQPTKFELVINLKTAKALGVTVPPALLARADEIIE